MPTIANCSALVREAFSPEFEEVRRMLAAANAQFEPVLPRAVYRVYLDDVLDLRSRLADSDLLVADFDGRIVGSATFYPDASREKVGWLPGWAGIRVVGVHPDYRGRGIGRQLVEACVERARDYGVDAVCLHTADFMGAAVRLYEGLGFRRIPEYDRDLSRLFPGAERARLMAIAYRRLLDDRVGTW